MADNSFMSRAMCEEKATLTTRLRDVCTVEAVDVKYGFDLSRKRGFNAPSRGKMGQLLLWCIVEMIVHFN